MEPISIATTLINVGEKVYKLAKNVTDREAKRQLDVIADELRDLKQSVSHLEDENRDLREKLRFTSDDYEFRSPFWYPKAQPERALCPKCYADKVAAPMGEPGQGVSSKYRQCHVCRSAYEVTPTQMPTIPPGRRRGTTWG